MVRALGALERGSLVLDAAAASGSDLRRQDRQGRDPHRLGAALAGGAQPRPRPCRRFRVPGRDRGGGRRRSASRLLRTTRGEGSGPPGTVLDDALTVACGGGAVRILELQRAGRQAMKAPSSCAARRWVPERGSHDRRLRAVMEVRREQIADAAAVRAILEDAFGGSTEADLVDRLRASHDLVVALVAERVDGIAGYVAFPRRLIEAPTLAAGWGAAGRIGAARRGRRSSVPRHRWSAGARWPRDARRIRLATRPRGWRSRLLLPLRLLPRCCGIVPIALFRIAFHRACADANRTGEWYRPLSVRLRPIRIGNASVQAHHRVRRSAVRRLAAPGQRSDGAGRAHGGGPGLQRRSGRPSRAPAEPTPECMLSARSAMSISRSNGAPIPCATR